MRDAHRLTARNVFQRKMFTGGQNKSMGSSGGMTARNVFRRKMFTGSQNKFMGSSSGMTARNAFTLIEVMIAVMIISVVIATLLQMRGNSTHIFIDLDKKLKINQYTSFFASNENYGFENKNTSLDELISEFNLEDDLRRKLKNTNIEIIYQEISTIDMSEFDIGEKQEEYDEDNQENTEVSQMIFEVGKTILKTKDSSTAILRLRLQ